MVDISNVSMLFPLMCFRKMPIQLQFELKEETTRREVVENMINIYAYKGINANKFIYTVNNIEMDNQLLNQSAENGECYSHRGI